MAREMRWDQKSLLCVLTKKIIMTFLLILKWSTNHFKVRYLYLDPKVFEGFWFQGLFRFKNLAGLYPQE